MTRYVHLTPRIEAALALIGKADTVADIGCDHGRLTAALLQRGVCSRVVASDVSARSLQKARDLIGHIGLNDRVSFRVGDGLSVLRENECDALAILGMGGTLMTRILSAAPVPMMGAGAMVLQPMRAQAEIREYLFKNRYHVTDERIVREGERLYELLRVVPGEAPQKMPPGWPTDFFDVGFTAWQQNDPLLPKRMEQMERQLKKRLEEARGTAGEAKLLEKRRALETIRGL